MPFQRNDVKKNKILESALIVFKDQGFQGTTIIDIARHARVNKALVYYYFQDKQNLLYNIFSSNLKKIISEFRSEVSQASHEAMDFYDLIKIIRKIKEANKNFLLLFLSEVIKDDSQILSKLVVEVLETEKINLQSELNKLIMAIGISSELSFYNRELFVILSGLFLSDLISFNLAEVMLNISSVQQPLFKNNIDQIISHLTFIKN